MKDFDTKRFVALMLLLLWPFCFSIAQNSEPPWAGIPTKGSHNDVLTENGQLPGGRLAPEGNLPHLTALWDQEFAYDLTATLGGIDKLAGAVHFNNKFWVSNWSNNEIYEFDHNGNLVNSFTLSSGCFRSLTWDGTHIYGANVTDTIFEIDPVTETITGHILPPVPFESRFCAFDPTLSASGGFWIGNYNTDIVSIDKGGTVLTTIPASVHGLSENYGAAWDGVSLGGPYLWVFHQGGSNHTQIERLQLPSGISTPVSFDVYPDMNASLGALPGVAGGLFISSTYNPGKVTIGGIYQGNSLDILFGYELNEPDTTFSCMQEFDSKEIYFEFPWFDCASYQLVWNFGDGSPLVQGCNPVHLYTTIGTFTVEVTVTDLVSGDTSIYQKEVEVDCPSPDVFVQVDSTTLNNVYLSANVGGDPAYNPVSLSWSINNSFAGSGVSFSYNPNLYQDCTVEIDLYATNTCQASREYSITLPRKGYSQDFPKDLARPVGTPGHTPLVWETQSDKFPNNPDGDKVDNTLSNLGASNTVDILVYYQIPQNEKHADIKSYIDGIVGGHMPARVDRFSTFLTVVNITDADQNLINDLIAEPYIIFVQNDDPVPAHSQLIYPNIFAPNVPLGLDQINDMFNLKEVNGVDCSNQRELDAVGKGGPIGICILGGGVTSHYAFGTLKPGYCSDPLNPDQPNPPNFGRFYGQQPDTYLDCNNPFVIDASGKSAAKASLLTFQRPWLVPVTVSGQAPSFPFSEGIANTADFYFFQVIDPNTETVKGSDVIEAVDHLISMQAYTPHPNIVICDFDLGYPSEGIDAVSSIMEMASRYGLACIAGSGLQGSLGLTAPAASPEVISVAPFLYTDCAWNPYHAYNLGLGGEQDLYWSKPDIGAPGYITGANLSGYSFAKRVAGSEVPAFIVGGLIALICEKRNDLTKDEVKLLLTSSAREVLFTYNPAQESGAYEGHGLINLGPAIFQLDSTQCYDLGFKEHIFSPDSIARYDSRDIQVVSQEVLAGRNNFPLGKVVRVDVVVHNFGNNTYPGSDEQGLVKLKSHYIGNEDILFIPMNLTQPIPEIAVDDSAIIQFEFEAKIRAEDLCFAADIVCPMDISKLNNQAKINDYRRVYSAIGYEHTANIPVTAPLWTSPNGTSVDSVYIFSVTPTNLPAPYSVQTNFSPGWYYQDDLPFWTTYTITLDTDTFQPPIVTYPVTYYAVTSSGETLYNGGVKFTMLHPSAVGTNESLEPYLGELKVFPNPTEDGFQLQFNPNSSGKAVFHLFNQQGKAIRSWEENLAIHREYTKEIDISDLSQGTYLLQIRMGDKIVSRKIIKV